jgi:hypothetical protein
MVRLFTRGRSFSGKCLVSEWPLAAYAASANSRSRSRVRASADARLDAHLSRVIRGVNYKSASGDLAGRVAEALGLPRDYFPKYREGIVIDRVKTDPLYRDRLYDGLRDARRGVCSAGAD